MSKPILRLLGIAALLLFFQIIFVNALLGAREKSTRRTTAESSTLDSADSPPNEALSSDNGRYDLVLNSQNRNAHFLVDSAEGRVWQARFDSDELATKWRRVEIKPSPPSGASPGRFRISSNPGAVRDTFLFDTKIGDIYLLLVDEQQNATFQGLSVDDH